MSLISFIKSKTFAKQILVAATISIVLLIVTVFFLDTFTRHGQEILVPNLSKMKLEIAQQKLEEQDLTVFVLDTLDYNENFPPFSIIEQDPIPNSTVKEGRKIYVKLNAGGFAMVTMPNLNDKTYRNIQATLIALGLKEGKVTYKPYLAKDYVLEVIHKGKKLKEGDKVLKSTTIDLVLGDGKEIFDDSTIDYDSEIPTDSIPETE